MSHSIRAGCDWSDRSMMLQIAHQGKGPRKKAFAHGDSGLAGMIAYLHAQAKKARGARIVFACQAGPHGFGLHDAVTDHGIARHVPAPSKMPASRRCRVFAARRE